jgi:hypothetical protein
VAVAAWPAAALLFSVEVVTNPSRRRKVLKMAAKAAAEAENLLRAALHRPSVAQPQPSTSATPETPPTGGQTAGNEPASAGNGTPHQASPTTGTTVTPRPVRAARPEDSEPLPERLIVLARQVGGAWRDRTGREITRDGLRNGLPCDGDSQ